MENKRFSVNIGITLSSNLISACLSMLAIIGAIFLFVIEKRETSIAFYVFILLSFFLFIYSIVLGGQGINIAREKSFVDILDLSYTKQKFNYQAITCLLGISFCIISIFFTKTINENNTELHDINKNLEKLIEIKKTDNQKYIQLKNQIGKLENRIKKLENKK